MGERTNLVTAMALGMVLGLLWAGFCLPSSTLIQIAAYTNSTVERASLLFAANSLFYLLGSVVPSLRTKRMPGGVISVLIVIAAACLVMVPLTRILELTIFWLGLAAAITGFYEAVATRLAGDLGGARAEFFLVINKAGGLMGTALQPVVTMAFLPMETDMAQSSSVIPVSNITDTVPTSLKHALDFSTSSLSWQHPYMAVAGLLCVVNIFLGVLLWKTRNISEEIAQENVLISPRISSGPKRVLTLVLILLLTAVYNGASGAFLNFITTYSVLHYDVGLMIGNSVLLVGGIGSLIGSALTMFFVKRFGILPVVLIALILSIISSLACLVFQYLDVLWAVSFMFLAASAAIYSAPAALMSTLVGLSERTVSAIIVSQCLGEILNNLLVGYFVEKSRAALPTYLVSVVVLSLLVYVMILVLFASSIKKEKSSDSSKKSTDYVSEEEPMNDKKKSLFGYRSL